MSYGVTPQGFNRKPLSVILAEIEAQMITEFGPGVVQTAASPLGQLNGLMANLIAQLWEFGQATYQSYDVDQAEGIRLDILAKMRLLERSLNEPDTTFRTAITNQGRARIDMQDIIQAVRNVGGVTYAQIFINDSSLIDANNLPPGGVAVAVLGGSDEDIAFEMRRFVVPGVSTFGNTYVSTTIDGFCRTMTILRPFVVPVKLNIKVSVRNDYNGCPPPSVMAMAAALAEDFTSGDRMLINGDDISFFRIRSAIESRFPNVEVLSFTGERDEIEGTQNSPVLIDFYELATVVAADVSVDAV